MIIRDISALYVPVLESREKAMVNILSQVGYAKQFLGIKGIGVVTAASFLSEVGDPLRFQNACQIANYAGYNLVERLLRQK